jgi:hypothetical protein
MIAAKCFGQEWISAKAEELRYPDKNVIERVVRAFSLLDMLARSGCQFVFNQEPEQIKSYLFANGFVWGEDQQQFRPIGYDA